MEEKNEKHGEKKVKTGTVLKALALVILAYLVLAGILIYFLPFSGGVAGNFMIKKTMQYVPYPAALFAGKPISASKLAMELASVKIFYENQDFSKLGMRIDFETPDGKKRLSIKEKEILNKLIEDAVIESEANKRGIKITAELVDQEVSRKLKEYGTEEFLKENLQKLYGWNTEDFKENIVKPDLYKEKLEKYIIENDSSRKSSKEKIDSAFGDLEKGIDFKEVVKKYSDGESSKNSGELGWFSLGQMIPELASEISNKEKGYQSEVLESSIGYHIVRVEDKKIENNIAMYKLAQIFARSKSFAQWLSETKMKYRILIPLREFEWNRAIGEAQFLDEGMKNYEKDLMEKSTSDPSIIY